MLRLSTPLVAGTIGRVPPFSLFLPELRHVLQRLTLGFGNEAPDEDGCYHTDNAIEAIGEPVAEMVTLRQMHVEHRHER